MKITSWLLVACTGILSLSACENANSELQRTNSVKNDTSSVLSDESIDTNRILLKTAELDVQVNDIQSAVQQIQQHSTSIAAHVEHYEINTTRNALDDIAFSLDSSYRSSEIFPQAQLKIQVPVDACDSFIRQMLSMGVRVNRFLFDEEDITETLKEKQALAALNIQGRAKPKSLIQQSWLEEHAAEKIKQRYDVEKLQYRSRYVCFAIHLNGLPYTETLRVANIADMRTPLWVEMSKALLHGWYLFSGFVLALVSIWPLMIAALFGWIVWRNTKQSPKRFNLFQAPKTP